jgi:hypothetical protein
VALELTQSVPAVLSFAVALMLSLFDLMVSTGLMLSLGLAVPVVTGLPLVVTLELGLTDSAGLLCTGGGVVTGGDGVTFGGAVEVTVRLGEMAGLAGAALLGGHTVTAGLGDATGVLPTPSAPAEVPLSRPLGEPAGLGAPALCCEESPTELPSWTKAARSGGSDSATPAANTAQATATAGRIMRCRQSSDGRVWPFLLRPCRPWADAGCARAPGAAIPPDRALCRRIQPASPEPEAGASALSLVKEVPARTRARIRSSPSGRGST